MTQNMWKRAVIAGVAGGLLAVSGCSTTTSAGGSTASNSGGASSAGGSASGSGTATAGGEGISAAALATAKANLAPYTGHPSAFPVDKPLLKKPAAGTKFSFLQCSTPICALFAKIIQGPTHALGVELTVTKAGPSAQALQTAVSSIVAGNPAAVLIPAADPVQYRQGMQDLADKGIPVVSQGVVDGAQFPAIKASILSDKATTLAGKLLADWVVQRNGTKPSVFYSVPELSFSTFIAEGYKKEMASLCPSCVVRYEKLPITTIGSTAPTAITSDLQKHPETKTVVFASLEAAGGLPAAMKVAGLTADTVGFAPDPAVLGYIKSGDITAGLGYDTVTSTWVQVDIAARLIAGEPLTAAEMADENVMQMLEKGDITFDPSHGYSGYPDIAERFAKLWPSSAS